MSNEHKHNWIANSGRGGQPEFRINKHLSPKAIMHVKCNSCNSRTWVDEDSWEENIKQLATSKNKK